MHARTRNRLIGVHQVFALAEGVQHHGHCANVQRVTTDPQQVVQDARHFIEHDADVLGTLRHFDAGQLFDGHAVSMLVTHHRHIVETIHVRNRLDPGAGLGQLFGRAMQQTDMRVGTNDDFAVQLKHQTQHTVCCRMLRTEVKGVVLNLSHGRSSPRARYAA